MDIMDHLSNTVETDRLISQAVKHLAIDTPVVAARVQGEALHLTLLGGQELSCKLSDLSETIETSLDQASAKPKPAKPGKKHK
jgi:hypothetical protein